MIGRSLVSPRVFSFPGGLRVFDRKAYDQATRRCASIFGAGGHATIARKKNAGGAAWTPATPGNLVAWWKADAGVTESGGAVTQWDDQSGNSRHLVTGDSPTYSATGWKSTTHAITFNGSSDWLKNITDSALYGLVNGTNVNHSILVAIDSTYNANFKTVVCFDDSAGSHKGLSSVGSGGFSFATDGVNSPAGSVAQARGFNATMSYCSGGGTITTYVNGLADPSGATCGQTLSGSNRFVLGLNTAVGAAPFAGQIVEVAIYSAKLVESDDDDWREYIKGRWLWSPTIVGITAISTNTNSSSATSQTLPLTPDTGDLLFAHVAVTDGSGTSVTPPSGEGWSLIDTGTSGSGGTIAKIYWKRWGAGDTDNTTSAFTGTAGNMRVTITVVRDGKSSGTPYAVSANAGSSSSGTTATAPAVTSPGAARLLLRFFTASGTATNVSATSENARYSGSSYGFTSGVDGCMGMSSLVVGSGDTGTATATLAVSGDWGAVTVAVDP